MCFNVLRTTERWAGLGNEGSVVEYLVSILVSFPGFMHAIGLGMRLVYVIHKIKKHTIMNCNFDYSYYIIIVYDITMTSSYLGGT